MKKLSDGNYEQIQKYEQRLKLKVPQIPTNLNRIIQNTNRYKVENLVHQDLETTILNHATNEIKYFDIDEDEEKKVLRHQ